MSAEAKLYKIKRLESAISQLKAMAQELDSYAFTQFKKAGSGQWVGQKEKRFQNQLSQASTHFNQSKSQLESAIRECRSRQMALAGSIDAVEHPIISAEAWSIAFF